MDIDLPRVAKCYRLLSIAFLLHLCAVPFYFALERGVFGGPSADPAAAQTQADLMFFAIRVAIWVAGLAIGLFAVFSVVSLLAAMHKPVAIRALAAIGMFVPILGLLVIFVALQLATNLLKPGGYRMGLVSPRPR